MISTSLGSVAGVIGRIPILDAEPAVDCGRRPARAVAGETFQVSATIFREGHGIINAGVVLRDPERQASPLVYMRELAKGKDRWGADVTVTRVGLWRFHVEAWADPIASWHHDAAIKIPAGQDVELMLAEGALLFERASRRIPQPPGAARPAAARAALRALAAKLRDRGLNPWDRLAATEDPQITAILATWPPRELVTRSRPLTVQVDRERALYGSWYEFFPRSEGVQVDPMGRRAPVSGTLRTAAKRLDAIAAMGFDVVYLPPVHPIGTTFRKGRNNTLHPVEGDRGPGRRARRAAPGPGHDGRLRRLCRPDPRAGHGSRAGPGAAGLAGPSVGEGAPGVVQQAGGRDHRVRREPAQEIPGHLPAELRQRPRGHLRGGTADRPAVDRPRRADLPRRQPAHQAAAVLGVAVRPDPVHRHRRAVPGRGVHPPSHDAHPGQDRLPAVLHVLHLA